MNALENAADDGYYANYYNTYGYDFAAPWDAQTQVSDYLQAAMTAVAESSSVASVYFGACGWRTGMALTVVLIINLFFAGISSLTVTSRIAFAMARDGAFPYSESLRVVWPVTKSPVRTVLLVFVVDALLLLLPLATTVALSAVLAITVIGYQVSYAIPILLRVTTGRKTFRQGAFSLGRYSMPIHAIGGGWLFLTSFIFFWPTKWPVIVSGVNGGDSSTDNMNYTCVIVLVTLFTSMVYWVASARHHFKGPLGRMADAELAKSAAAVELQVEAEQETSK
jgi:amino acid transporter